MLILLDQCSGLDYWKFNGNVYGLGAVHMEHGTDPTSDERYMDDQNGNMIIQYTLSSIEKNSLIF